MRDLDDLMRRLRRLFPDGDAPLHAPTLSAGDAAAVAACVESGWVSSAGPDIQALEATVADVSGTPAAVAVSSGTAALQVSLTALGVENGDEVILPALTFAATAAAVCHAGGVPHFTDIDTDRLGLCPAALSRRLEDIATRLDGTLRNRQTGRRIRAVIAVHVFGRACWIDEIKDVCDSFNLPLLEDAAEALGSKSEGRALGTIGSLGVLSFNGNKIVTTGGGGAIIGHDAGLLEAVRHLSTTAKRPHPYEYIHDAAGFNFRMPNLNAALGVSQLTRLEHIIDAKRAIFDTYRAAFEGCNSASILDVPAGTAWNYWLVTAQLTSPELLQPLLEATNAAGIQTRPIWRPLHLLEPYENAPRGRLQVTEDVGARLINFPSGPDLALSLQARVT